MFADALAMHQAGRLADAESLYRTILGSEPRHFDSCHHLGLIHHQRGEHAAALSHIDAALKLDPGSSAAYNNRGVVLAALGRLEEATSSYDRAIALQPGYVDALFNRGNSLKDLTRFDEALASYDKVAALAPGHAPAWCGRGNVLYGLGCLEEAIAAFDRAIALKPDYAEAWSNRGVALAERKRLEEAVASYDRAIALGSVDADLFDHRGLALAELGCLSEAIASHDRAIAAKPGRAQAFWNRANVLRQSGRLAEALDDYDRAIALKPDYAQAHNNRGSALTKLERFEDAAASFDRAVTLKPDCAEAFYNQGSALGALKRFDAALVSYGRAIALDAGHAEAFNNRGNVLNELRRFDEALADYDRAIALKPDYADARNNRGIVLRELRRFDQALEEYRNAIALDPGSAEYHNNSAIVLADLKRFDEALAGYGKAIAIKPDYAEAHSNRGFALRDLKRFEEALASFSQALALRPDLDYVSGTRLHAKMHLCDWAGFDRDCLQATAALMDGDAAAMPFQMLPVPAATPEHQLRCAGIYGRKVRGGPRESIWRGQRYAHDRIRIGYLSADFRDHPIAVLTAGLFARHDRGRFETVAISLKSDPHNRVRERFGLLFDRFVDAEGMSDDAVAMLVREFEIDIVVDLNGFTEGSRPNILAQRPAPIQVNYLGYAGTLGQDYCDYIIADRFVIPEADRAYYAEQVVYLPDCFMVNDSERRISARTPSRADAGLPESGFVFCCFNNSYKITPDVFDVWMRLLGAVDGSVLWLSAANAGAVENLRREAARRGVAGDRLIFAPRVPLNEDHLARVRLADLFVDTLYYNAHTTAADALWAGVPVVTCAGATFASRVAGSLLHAVGLPELVTESVPDYEALALALARDPARLAALRETLARNRDIHPLFDTARFTRHIEAAYATMWERTQRGEPPQGFAVGAIERGRP